MTVWHDPARTRAWNLDNLNSYWRAWVARGRGIPRRTVLVASRRLLDGAIAWGVPGVARLHYTIATGDVTSKSGACRYALTTFPERWHPIVREALALRHGEPTEMRGRRHRYHDALAFMDFVIADATTPAVSRL